MSAAAATQLIALLAQTEAPVSGMGILALCFLGAIGIGLALPHKRSLMTSRGGFALAAVAGIIFGVLLLKWSAQDGSVNPYFWAFAAISIVAAVRVITHTKPVYSALYFVMSVFAAAGLFVLLNAQFMAAALVLIYAGAVLVTYTFVIMLAAESTGGTGTNVVTSGSTVDTVARDPFIAGAVGFTLMAVLLMAVFDTHSLSTIATSAQKGEVTTTVDRMSGVMPGSPSFAAAPAVAGDTQVLGRVLYTDHAVSIQVAMLILTLAMTGAVIIARRRVYVATPVSAKADTVVTPSTPSDDNPHTIPIYGTDNPRAKEYPQT